MNEPTQKLIFDRTQADVDNDLPKGQLNPSDLNRVEIWCDYLATELNAVGYNIQITTKTNWVQTDPREAAEMERIRSNIKKIQQGYTYITEINASAENFDWRKANNWEKILNEIYYLMYGMKSYYVYGGVARGGQPRLYQNRFRRYKYTPKEFIKSSGTQYIDTGIKSQVGIKLEMDFEPANYGEIFYGSHYNSPNMSLMTKSDGTWQYIVDGHVWYANSSKPKIQFEKQTATFYMNAEQQNLTIDNTIILTTTNEIAGVSNYNLFLFYQFWFAVFIQRKDR